MPAISQTATTPSSGHDAGTARAERTMPSADAPPLGGDRDQRADDGADRARGRDRADAAAAQRAAGRGRPRPRGRAVDGPWPLPKIAVPTTNSAKLPVQIARPQISAPSASRLRPASSTGLRPRFCGDAADDEEREHAEQERDADARAGQSLVARETLGGDGADRRVERQRRAHEDLRAREPPGGARELARDDQIDAGRAHARSMSHGIRLTRRGARGTLTCHVSHNLWFLWLILGLKVPLIGLFYFIFRVMRAQDKAWEQGELDGGWGDDDDGGGGEPRVKPPHASGRPGRPPAPAAAARAAARACAACRCAAPPRRRAEPLRTHDPRPVPERTALCDALDYSRTVSTCAS